MIVGIILVGLIVVAKIVISTKKEMEEGRRYLYNTIMENADHLVKNENQA